MGQSRKGFVMGSVRVIFDVTNMEDIEAGKVQRTLRRVNGVDRVEMIHPHGTSANETHEFWVDYDPQHTSMAALHQDLERDGYRNFAVSL